MRQSICFSLLLLLVACRSGQPSHPATAQEAKKPPKQDTIHAGDFLASPENCGMIDGVQPVYPKEAQRAHVEGVVKFSVMITKTGEVADLLVLSGNPVLVPAAVKAVRQSRYAPCRLNGDPVEVKTQIDISFTLSQ